MRKTDRDNVKHGKKGRLTFSQLQPREKTNKLALWKGRGRKEKNKGDGLLGLEITSPTAGELITFGNCSWEETRSKNRDQGDEK